MKEHTERVFIVIPVFNEEESIETLGKEINAAMAPTDWDWTCVWVDDGSTDGTAEKLREMCSADPAHQQWAFHEGNFGQSAALFTGFKQATDGIIATIDGDGQNDPKDIPVLLHKLMASGAGLVNGVRVNRRDSIVRKISSKIANTVRRWVTRDGVTDVGCSLRVFRKEYVEDLILFKGMHRFLPALIRQNGCEAIEEVPVHHRPRLAGTSKYGIGNRLWVGLFDLVGIVWIRKRGVRPVIRETSNGKEGQAGGKMKEGMTSN